MARLRALEPRHTTALRLALVRQAEEAVTLLLQFQAVPDAAGAALIAARVSSRWLVDPLRALYVACGDAEAASTFAYLTRGRKAQAPPATRTGWLGRLTSFISTEGAAAVRGITESTRRVVRDALAQSAAAGEGIQAAAGRLRARVATLAPARARRIVRTELITAAAQGSLLGAQATGLALDKMWISTPGARTRASHAAAGGQTVDINALFSVDGQPARYPGDPMLTVGQRANCRCAIGFKPKQ